MRYTVSAPCVGILIAFSTLSAQTVRNARVQRLAIWCSKGHILLCLEGELHTELADGRTFVLTPGMSYQVADNTEPHRSSTTLGAKLFIVD
jgi:hypothetical protein